MVNKEIRRVEYKKNKQEAGETRKWWKRKGKFRKDKLD